MSMDRRGALKLLAHVGVEVVSAPALSLSMVRMSFPVSSSSTIVFAS